MSLSLYKYKYDDDVYDDNVNYDDYDVFDDKVDYDDYNAYDDYDLGGGSWYKLMKANWERAWRIKVATSKVREAILFHFSCFFIKFINGLCPPPPSFYKVTM